MEQMQEILNESMDSWMKAFTQLEEESKPEDPYDEYTNSIPHLYATLVP